MIYRRIQLTSLALHLYYQMIFIILEHSRPFEWGSVIRLSYFKIRYYLRWFACFCVVDLVCRLLKSNWELEKPSSILETLKKLSTIWGDSMELLSPSSYPIGWPFLAFLDMDISEAFKATIWVDFWAVTKAKIHEVVLTTCNDSYQFMSWPISSMSS